MNSRKLFTLFLMICPAYFSTLPSQAAEPSKRSKSINFEDNVIEGINRKSLDSVAQISENDAHKKAHLYKRRATFTDRDSALINTLPGSRK